MITSLCVILWFCTSSMFVWSLSLISLQASVAVKKNKKKSSRAPSRAQHSLPAGSVRHPQRMSSCFVINSLFLYIMTWCSILAGQCGTFRDSSCCVDRWLSAWSGSYSKNTNWWLQRQTDYWCDGSRGKSIYSRTVLKYLYLGIYMFCSFLLHFLSETKFFCKCTTFTWLLYL